MNPCCFGSPNHGYPADPHWGARNRDSRTCHVACVGKPRAEVERYSINLFFPTYHNHVCIQNQPEHNFAADYYYLYLNMIHDYYYLYM